MKIEIEATWHFENINGQPCRLWRGTSDTGIPVVAFVAMIRTDIEHASESQVAELDRELRAVKNERHLVSFDNRLVV